LEWAGLKLDEKRNQGTVGSEGQISTDDSRLRAFVIPTDEELLIARDTVRCVLGQQDASQFEHHQPRYTRSSRTGTYSGMAVLEASHPRKSASGLTESCNASGR